LCCNLACLRDFQYSTPLFWNDIETLKLNNNKSTFVWFDLAEEYLTKRTFGTDLREKVFGGIIFISAQTGEND